MHLEWRPYGYAPIRRGESPVPIEWPFCVCYGCGAEWRGKPPPDPEHTQIECTPQAFYDGPFRSE